jgi:hypothetical protein
VTADLPLAVPAPWFLREAARYELRATRFVSINKERE